MCFFIHRQLSSGKVIKWQIPFTPRKSHFLTHKSKWEGLGRFLDGENVPCLIVFKQSCFQVCREDTLTRTQCVCKMSPSGGWKPGCLSARPLLSSPLDAAALSCFSVCSPNCRASSGQSRPQPSLPELPNVLPGYLQRNLSPSACLSGGSPSPRQAPVSRQVE